MIDLQDPSVIRYMDEDEKQEFYCLILEGFPENEAAKLARSANDKVNSRRLSGPLTGDTRHGHGHRPIVSDMTNMDIYSEAMSVTQDWRDDVEREADHSRQAPDIDEILSWLTPRQREFVVHKFGLGIEPAQTVEELAERLGVAKGTAGSTMKKIRRKIQDIHDAGGYHAWQSRVHLARYEAGNQGRRAAGNRSPAATAY